MKALSAICLTLILVLTVSSLGLRKTKTKNFTGSCRRYNYNSETKILRAECRTRDGRNVQTQINLVESILIKDYESYDTIGRCRPEEQNLDSFEFKFYCNMKRQNGKVFKFTGVLNLGDFIENIDGQLELTNSIFDEDYFFDVLETPERANLE
jgi:hypothetical protein